MNRTLIRRIAIGVFLLNALAVTWPVASFFKAAKPLVFGFPLSMVWPVAWIVVGLVMLLVLDHFENGHQAENRDEDQ